MRERALAAFPNWERYEHNVASYLVVPSLDAAMVRLDPEKIESWLADPHDLRPGLPETMPRFDLSPEELAAIGAAFAAAQEPVPATPAPSEENVAAGAALFVEKACTTCHALGGLHTGGIPTAPDLAHTRDRMDPDRTVAWILDPRGMSAGGMMPRMPMTTEEAVAIRDYIFLVDPEWSEAPPLSPTVVASTAPTSWDEVNERVFGKICAHCHMDPEQNQGRAGPGNAGGFGYAATGIELQTYEGVVAAADRITASLDRRRAEAHRDVVDYGERPATLTRPEAPGMPLGLPPLSDEDHALVLAWIEQGFPK
ncbi:MAG TPA: cytochrome c [Myxococcota bacterium]|nr:cytochrome c [Myxococcota bacterium]